MMKVRELMALLSEFPDDMPVFFLPEGEGQGVFAPKDAVMNLVHPERGQVVDETESSADDLAGFVDSVVIYPRVVREDL
jgi:hypothetical protein